MVIIHSDHVVRKARSHEAPATGIAAQALDLGYVMNVIAPGMGRHEPVGLDAKGFQFIA